MSLCAQDVRSALVTLMKVTILEASKNSQTIDIPLYSSSVQAGFPSPADDYIEAKIDLNKHIIKRPAATFFAGLALAGLFFGEVLFALVVAMRRFVLGIG